MVRRLVPLLVTVLLLAGCATVRGWFGGGAAGDDAKDEEKDAPRAAVPAPARAPAPAKAPPNAEHGTAPKPAKGDAAAPDVRSSADIRRELKAIGEDAKSGRIGTTEAKKRLRKLGEELEDVLAAEARRGGRAPDLAALMERLGDLARKLDDLSDRMDDLERRVEALEKE